MRADATITVLLPTFRRPASLERALKALAGQKDPGLPWEILVVDNDDPPGADETFDALAPSLGVPARLVREPRRGAAHARNRGIAEATGTITAMTDDDCAPAPDWLARLVEPIVAGRSDASCGRVLLDPSVPRPRWFDETVVGGYIAYWNPATSERPLGPKDILVTSNCAFRADMLRRTGGFDPRLGHQGDVIFFNEDTLLGWRFMSLGGRIVYVPEAEVVHELPLDRLRPGHVLRRAYAIGRSQFMLDQDFFTRERRFYGAGFAVKDLAARLRKTRRKGLRRDVAFAALVDGVRTAGLLREIAAHAVRRARGDGGAP